MGFKLKLKGYFDGNSIQEVGTTLEGVVVSFEKYLSTHEGENVEETISTFVMPLTLATVPVVVDIEDIIEQPVVKIIQRATALVQTTQFTHFPDYNIVEYPDLLSTITFDREVVTFEGDVVVSMTCTLNGIITTDYTYSPNGDVPVAVQTVDGFLGYIHPTARGNLNQKIAVGSSIRTNMHQLNKNPVSPQGEIGATQQDKCLNFGVITSDKHLTFTITSGEPYDLQISEILIPVWMGVDFSDIGVGTILPAGGSLTFNILAFAGLGRDDVKDFTTIKFEEVTPRYGSTQRIGICIEVHRRHAPNILIIPDKGSYKETIEYSTKSFKSVSNITKTTPQMLNYKYSCKYTVTMHRTDYHKSFINTLMSGKEAVFQHPLWSQVTLLQQEMQSSLFCKCDTSGCDFRVDSWVFIYVRPDEYYLRQITTLTNVGIMLSRTTTAYKGAFVVPAFPAMVKGTISTNYIGERFIKGEVELIEFREGEYYVSY